MSISQEAINWTFGVFVLVVTAISALEAWRVGQLTNKNVQQRVRLAWAHSLLLSALKQLPPGELAEEIRQFTGHHHSNAETIERKVQS